MEIHGSPGKAAADRDSHYPGTAALFAAGEFHSWVNHWQARLSRQGISRTEAAEKMRLTNPAVIPRNHKVEDALAAAVSAGDLSVMQSLIETLKNPFVETEANLAYRSPAPETGEPYRTFCGT